MNGRTLPLLCLLVIIAAALARSPGRLVGVSAIPLGLLVVLFLAAALVGVSPEKTDLVGQPILGLHAINGMAILDVTILLVRKASRFVAARPAAGPVLNPGRSRAQTSQP